MYDIELSNYWRTHYRFGKEGRVSKRKLGTDMINSILINTVAPALMSYSRHRLDDRYATRAVNLLRELPAENNKVMRRWSKLGMPLRNAGDSQALLHLKQQYCDRSRCTECALGCQILSLNYLDGDAAPLLTANEQARVYELSGVA